MLKWMLLLGVFFSQEAWVSQISYHKTNSSLDIMVDYPKEIWIVRDLKKTVSLKRVVFPKSTHWKKESETVFEVFAETYELLEPLKHSDLELKVGSEVKVQIRDAYNEALVKEYHETRSTESPIVEVHTPNYPVKGGTKILFLIPHSQFAGAFYKFNDAEEGIEAKAEILKLLRTKK